MGTVLFIYAIKESNSLVPLLWLSVFSPPTPLMQPHHFHRLIRQVLVYLVGRVYTYNLKSYWSLVGNLYEYGYVE